MSDAQQRWYRDRMYMRQQIDDLKTKNRNQAATIKSQKKLIDELMAKQRRSVELTADENAVINARLD